MYAMEIIFDRTFIAIGFVKRQTTHKYIRVYTTAYIYAPDA